MAVKISLDGEVMTAFLEGDIDHHTAKDIREEIDKIISEKELKLLKLDFEKIRFMDSSGIGLIMGRYKLIDSVHGNLRVVNVPKRIEKMVKLSGLMKLGIFEDENKKERGEETKI